MRRDLSMPTEYHRVTTGYTVLPKGAQLFDECATKISMDDEGSGAFVLLEQCGDHQRMGQIRITVEEWPAIRDAVEAMHDNIRAMELSDIVPALAK